MVEQQPSKLMTRVRFPSPAPVLCVAEAESSDSGASRGSAVAIRERHHVGSTDPGAAGVRRADGGEAHHAAVDGRQPARDARADAEDSAGVLELPARRAALHPGGRRRDHRGRGAPARAGAQQPDAQARRDPYAHLRDPAHQGRRDRARAPAFAGGAALRHRGRGRLHRGQRRAHLHEARRLHRDAGLDLARPRQGNRRRR